MENKIIAREMLQHELEAGLAVRNRIFGPITANDWVRGEKKTAAIAFDGDQAIGFIPLYMRDFRLTPEVRLTAAFENSVGTSEAYRGHGVGSLMIGAAREFLRRQADALVLYRGDERSTGYRFYTNTGHSDLHYIRLYTLDSARVAEAAAPATVSVATGTEKLLLMQEELLELFEQTYASFGGYPQRHASYWSHALSSTIYVARPAEFYFFELRENGSLLGYAIAGKEHREPPDGPLKVLEIASRDGDPELAQLVLQAVCAHAVVKGCRSTVMHAGYAHPFEPLLQQLGFQAGLRASQVMALCFDPSALFSRIWQERVRLSGITLRVRTPQREADLLDGGEAAERMMTLEMKEDMLNRWLLGRLDLRSRIREGSVTVMGGNDAILDEIVRAIPYADWVYHHLDYI